MHTIKNSEGTDYIAKSPSPFLFLGYLILICKKKSPRGLVSYLSEVFYTTPQLHNSTYFIQFMCYTYSSAFLFSLNLQLGGLFHTCTYELPYLYNFLIFKLHIIPLYGGNIIHLIIPNQWLFTLIIIFCCNQFCNELLYMYVGHSACVRISEG